MPNTVWISLNGGKSFHQRILYNDLVFEIDDGKILIGESTHTPMTFENYLEIHA